MIQGIILEGMSTAGKTSLFSAFKKLQSQMPNGERSMIAISEHYSQVLHSYHGVLKAMSRDEHIQLLRGHVDYLEQQSHWIDTLGHTKSTNGIFFILERFHLNHRAAFGSSLDIEILEQRLQKLNAQSVLLTLSPRVVEARYIESRGDGWKSYVMANHLTASEACEKFLEDQENLRRCAEQSRIPTIEIHTDDANWDAYASQILKVTSSS